MKKKSRAGGQASVHASQTVSEAFGAILRHNYKHLLAWEGAARSGDDIEGVHQLRVAFRRMRSALRMFRSAVPRPVTAPWADAMRELANQLGPARDLDVFIDEGLNAIADQLPLPGREKLLALARQRREGAYAAVRALLDSDGYAGFKEHFSVWLNGQGWLTGELNASQRERLESNGVSFARKLLDKQERRVLAAGSHVDQASAQAMHQLRIECKKLRYAAEFFTPLFEGMEDFINHLKGLQDLLGVMQDVTIMHHLLEGLLAGEQDPEVLRYAGGLVGWRSRQYYEIRNSFGERWEQFVSARHPWWGKAALDQTSPDQ
jgi:CHAD domain-containing protein